MKRGVLLLMLLIFSGVSLLPAQQLPPPEPLMPEEYDPEEFPLWAHDLRRYEVVAIGTYPITFFATSLIYDFSVYAANDWTANIDERRSDGISSFSIVAWGELFMPMII